MSELTARQQRFVEEYLIDLNATQAAIRAGYSEKTAQVQSSRLLSNVMVAAAIAEAQSARSERTEITQDMVVRELAKIGFSDLRKVLTKDGNLIDPQDWDDDTAGAIASLEVVTVRGSGDDERTSDHIHKIKVWDKNSALEKLGKHLAMFTDKVDHTSSDGTMSPAQMTEEQVDARLAELEGRRANDDPTVH